MNTAQSNDERSDERMRTLEVSSARNSERWDAHGVEHRRIDENLRGLATQVQTLSQSVDRLVTSIRLLLGIGSFIFAMVELVLPFFRR